MSESTEPVQDHGLTAFRGISHIGLTALIFTVVFTFFSLFCVALRVFIRLRDSKLLSRDDWTIIAGLVACLALSITECVGIIHGGFGWNTAFLPDLQLQVFFKVFFATNVIYTIVQPIVKISVLLLYMRIFNVSSFKKAAYFVMSLCVAWSIATFLVELFQCRPMRGAWSLWPPLSNTVYHCIDQNRLYLAGGISNLLLDLIILCLPMPMIWSLNLNKKKKVGVTAILLTGSLACVGSILRLTTITHIVLADFTYVVAPFCIWTTIEVNLAVIAACLPTFAALFKHRRHQPNSRTGQNRNDLDLTPLSSDAGGMAKSTGSSRKVFDPYSTDIHDRDTKDTGAGMNGWQKQGSQRKVSIETQSVELGSEMGTVRTEENVTPHAR